jgi:hypothetical protein
VARLLVLVGAAYNVVGLTVAFNSFGVTSLMMPVPPPWDPLRATIYLAMAIAVTAGAVLLPCLVYCRITRLRKQSAGILLIVGGAILTVTAPFFTVTTIISGVLFLAAGALALVSRPGEEPLAHVAVTFLPINR